MLHDLNGAVHCAFVLVSFETLLSKTGMSITLLRAELWDFKKWTRSSTNLHPGFNDIQGSVSKHTGSTSNSSKQSSQQRVDGFVGVVTLVLKNRNKRWLFAFLVGWEWWGMISSATHLCTSSSVKSWRRSGWPGWSPASVQWLLGPDRSPSVLEIHQYH